MSRRPATITQADIARIIRAARDAGAAEVELRINGEPVIVRLTSSTGSDAPLAPRQEVVL